MTPPAADPPAETGRLDQMFFALSDPIRRRILERLDGEALLVSELAAPFAISLQAVSRHIQVLVRAGLVQQERSGRISKCSLIAGPLFEAAVWMNRYSKYWQQQRELRATAPTWTEERRTPQRAIKSRRRGSQVPAAHSRATGRQK